MDVFAWLRELELGQYEAAFRDNAIDSRVLPGLTSADLKEMGVGPIGHRRLILDAIAGLKGESRREPLPAATQPAAPPPTLPLHGSAERRPITVMFCHLVGSTSLAANMDAEDWRDLVGAYLDEASRAVTKYGGHVLKKLGDGIMALFGYPMAQENDAERAARAGLAIPRALEELNAKNAIRGLPALAARIGLASGPVVVDQTGEVFGDTPNVAARVQSAAEPGTLIVTAAVQRQVAGLFVAEDKGPYELKGVPGKPTLYRLVRASGGGRRTSARSLTPLVGRDEDLALLARRWERVQGGEGQFVQIIGEPGIGKSRLMAEFRARLGETPHSWVEWSTSQMLQNTPLNPIVEWGRQRFGGVEIPSEVRLAELEHSLLQVKLSLVEYAPLLAPMLDISLPVSSQPTLAPQVLRRRQLAAVVSWLLAGARQQPAVLAFEDLHWADPTTLDLMNALADRGVQAPLLIVATARPEFRAPWATRSHHSVISLFPLDRAAVREMVASITERHALAKSVVERVGDRTGGVPLFVEEVTWLLLDGGAHAIPPTLQHSLAARLDRLGEAREVAQIGAVLGREFSHSLLVAVANLPAAALDAALERLGDADFLFVEGIAPAATYRFKHALIQDAAYESLLKASRQALHRRAAEALLTGAERTPELVAHHFTQSGQTEQAAEWWGKAGEEALSRNAFSEAASHLGKAIELADRKRAETSNTSAIEDNRMKLQADFTRALAWSKGYAANETRAAIETLEAGFSAAADTSTVSLAANGRYIDLYTRGDMSAAKDFAEGYWRRARDMGAESVALHFRRQLGEVDFELGAFGSARDHLQCVVDAWDELRDAALIAVDGIDALSHANAELANVLAVVGEIDAAGTLAKAAFERAERLGGFRTLAAITVFGLRGLVVLEKFDAVQARAGAFLARASAEGAGVYELVAKTQLAWASGSTGGNGETAIAQISRSLSVRLERGELGTISHTYSMLADVQLVVGRTNEALSTIEDGIAIGERTGCHCLRSKLLRLRGFALSVGDPIAAEAAFHQAVSVARAQGARTFELQAALPLARLLLATNRSLEARDVLAPALEGFAPTPELPAIAEALEVLKTLRV